MSKLKKNSQGILKSESNQVEEILSEESSSDSNNNPKIVKNGNKDTSDDFTRKRFENSELSKDFSTSEESGDENAEEIANKIKLPIHIRVISLLHIFVVGILLIFMVFFYSEYVAVASVDEDNMDNKIYLLYITGCGLLALFLCYTRSLLYNQ